MDHATHDKIGSFAWNRCQRTLPPGSVDILAIDKKAVVLLTGRTLA